MTVFGAGPVRFPGTAFTTGATPCAATAPGAGTAASTSPADSSAARRPAAPLVIHALFHVLVRVLVPVRIARRGGQPLLSCTCSVCREECGARAGSAQGAGHGGLSPWRVLATPDRLTRRGVKSGPGEAPSVPWGLLKDLPRQVFYEGERAAAWTN
ncbi:hypothetical protein SRO_5020 [Streptomyces rochei]|nr:hypothetical protein SRO_5020 [Streptomyces rochei]